MLLGKFLAVIAIAIAGFAVVGVFASSIEYGKPTVIDGDTIEIHGQRIRLFGIDAPESSQTCRFAGEAWRCGQKSALALADYLGDASVSCRPRGKSYNRVVAVCFKGLSDIGEHQVRQGWAMASPKYSMDYVDEEALARRDLKGFWSSTIEAPWLYRRRAKGSRDTEVP